MLLYTLYLFRAGRKKEKVYNQAQPLRDMVDASDIIQLLETPEGWISYPQNLVDLRRKGLAISSGL